MEKEIFQELQMLGENIEQQKLLTKEIFNLQEASKYLGLSKSALYKKTSLNVIPFYKPNGKIIYFKKADLDDYMLSNRQPTDDEIREKANNFKLKSKN
jgi:excisionase family DNA binding protein